MSWKTLNSNWNETPKCLFSITEVSVAIREYKCWATLLVPSLRVLENGDSDTNTKYL